MNNIILIDDRPKRMSLAFDKIGQDLNLYLSLSGLNIPLDHECIKIKDDLNKGSGFYISHYHLIIVHQSALNGIGLNTLESICKLNKSKLILFSGSIRQPVFSTTDGFQKLIVNSKDLYSALLLPFIQKIQNNKLEHLTELIYADKWKLSIALIYRQLLMDVKYGDDIKAVPHKNKQLLNCISILGELNFEELNNIISEQIEL
jgi:hypothetical protein